MALAGIRIGRRDDGLDRARVHDLSGLHYPGVAQVPWSRLVRHRSGLRRALAGNLPSRRGLRDLKGWKLVNSQ